MEAAPPAAVKLFSIEDYVVFASMLMVSAGIGVYYGFFKTEKKQLQNGADEFLIGGGKMKTIPVGLSLLAGFLSSITLMGQPAEVYRFGPQIWLLGFGSFVIVPVVCHIFVPFFRGLDTTSAYAYFGRRFSRSFQLYASTVFSLQTVIFLALVLYAPALALHQVTGMDTYVVVTAMYVVCIFYTTVGGVRAVIWTDTFQVVVLFAAMLAILIKGTLEMGGLAVVFQTNAQYQRNNFFNFDPDPTVRYSVWSSFFGGACLHLSTFSGNQLQIQRFLSVKSNKEARKMVWIYAIGWAIVASMTAYAGMLIFARYAGCDPLMTKAISSADQLFPFYVMDVLGVYKGLPGLFVAGIFAAGLSTVSTGVNSLAAIWFDEMDGTDLKKSLSPAQKSMMVKLLALIFGLVSFAVSFLVPYMGSLVPISISLNGFFSGALGGIFLLGIYVPFANAWGAFFGLTSGISVAAWLTVGAQISARNGLAVLEVLPLTTESCSSNVTMIAHAVSSTPPPPPLALAPYRISFMWYALIAFLLTVAVGALVSLIVRYVRSISVKTVFGSYLHSNRAVEQVFTTEAGTKMAN